MHDNEILTFFFRILLAPDLPIFTSDFFLLMSPDLLELPVIMIYVQTYVLNPLFHDISLI